jgi:hypothetical protein
MLYIGFANKCYILASPTNATLWLRQQGVSLASPTRCVIGFANKGYRHALYELRRSGLASVTQILVWQCQTTRNCPKISAVTPDYPLRDQYSVRNTRVFKHLKNSAFGKFYFGSKERPPSFDANRYLPSGAGKAATVLTKFVINFGFSGQRPQDTGTGQRPCTSSEVVAAKPLPMLPNS